MNNNQFTGKARKLFDITYSNAVQKFDETTSLEIATLAVETLFTKQNNTWVYKTEKHYITADMIITKATIDKDGNMLWNASASDTGWDLFEERMSLELYNGFIAKLDGHEYVSLSHYPSLEGEAEFGKAKSVYTDGDTLKARGNFTNDAKGTAAYNAIRKDRRDNVPAENRIRISIGFWDYMHTHIDDNNKSLSVWKSTDNNPCYLCATGIKGKVYLDGKLDHLALTRIPARITTRIDIEETK